MIVACDIKQQQHFYLFTNIIVVSYYYHHHHHTNTTKRNNNDEKATRMHDGITKLCMHKHYQKHTVLSNRGLHRICEKIPPEGEQKNHVPPHPGTK